MPASQMPTSPGPVPPLLPAVRVVAGGGNTPLPRPLTKLIARDGELDAVVSLLRDPSIRLLTLTGPGGVGKTRLAIAAAGMVSADFPDGVVFIDLSAVADANLVLSSIARSLGLRDTGSEALRDRLLHVIGERRLLLVMDNFEQVVVAATQVRRILDACPGVMLLITSRIRLRVSGEHEYPVAPLSLDGAANGPEAETSGAVRLFLERARAIRPDFGPAAETMPAVMEIVRRVDGLPLAIELAAARIKALPPAALLHRMEQQLPLLSGGARDLPLRQQTMRDTIGWSYDLLTSAERALFRRLGIFVGGFTLEAAEAIDAGAALEVVDGITALIEHSLLRQSEGAQGEPRYQMLETVREYARDRLAASGEVDDVQHRHAEFFLEFVEASDPHLIGPEQAEWLSRLGLEKDNIRAALQWSLNGADIRIETATRLGAALGRVWERRGFLSEGRAYLERILALPPDPALTATRCSVLTGSGVLAALQGDYDQAIRYSEQALAGWRQLGNHRGIARTLLCLATIARYQDDYAGAESLGHESLAAYRAIDDGWGIGHVLAHLGMVAWVQGDHTTGTAQYEEALALLRDVGDTAGIFEVLLELGKGACDAGELNRARVLFEECLGLSATLGDRGGRGATLSELGVVAWRAGDYTRASDLLLEANRLAQENGDRRQIAYLAVHLADVDVAMGDIASAAGRFAEALELFLPMGNQVGISQAIEAIARCAAIRGDLVAAIRLIGWSDARFVAIGATPPVGRDPATDAASLRSRVSPDEFFRAWDAGQALSQEEAVAETLVLAAALAADATVIEPPKTDVVSAAEALGLTRRETEVLRLLAKGMSDREIADALSISERTAGNHVQHAMQKIGVESRTAAAVFAVRNSLD